MGEILRFADVRLTRRGHRLLDGVDWVVEAGQRWVVLGPNGSGKTSLLRIAGGYELPSRGVAEVLGHRLGETELQALRRRIGFVSAPLARMLRPELTALDAVWTGRYALMGTFVAPSEDDRDRARALLAEMGCAGLEERRVVTLSEGERKRVQLARALMASPELLLLDEPAANLDLLGRELLLDRLSAAASDAALQAVVVVTHRVEEIPVGFTHLLLLRAGRAAAAGPLNQVLTAEGLSSCFGADLRLEERDGRYWAWSRASVRSGRG